MSEAPRVLLIYPPFSMPDKPYISLPVLAAHLRGRGIVVRALDANIEFLRRYAAPENVARGRAFAAARFAELNDRQALDAESLLEYLSLAEAFAGENAGEEPDPFADRSLPIDERMRLFRRALLFANAPNFPEGVDFIVTTGYIRHISKAGRFSPGDLVAAAAADSWLYRELRAILEPALKDRETPVVGISAAFPDQALAAFISARIIKEHRSDCHVVLGGTYVASHLRSADRPELFRWVDSLVLDDGERPLERLVSELSGDAPDLAAVPGLVWRRGNEILRNAAAPPIGLEEAPPPDYSIYDLDRYLVPRDRMALLFRLSSGCPWARCAFCRTELPFIRDHVQPTAERLYGQLRATVEATGVRIFHFTDDAASPPVMESLSRKLAAQGPAIRWMVNFRVDPRLTLERLLLFEQAGCHSLYLGIESYNDRILKLMRKGISVAQIDRTLDVLSWTDIRVTAYMIVGFPGETEAEALSSFAGIARLVKEGKIHECIYNVFELVPYSAVFREKAKFGVADVSTDPAQDLEPTATRFRSEGMTRERAFELCRRFIAELAVGDRSAPEPEPPRSLVVGGEPLALRFDLAEARRLAARIPALAVGHSRARARGLEASGISLGPRKKAGGAFTVWLTGLPGSGKTTLRKALAAALGAAGLAVEELDSDELPPEAAGSLGREPRDREIRARLLAYAAWRLNRRGISCAVAAVVPWAAVRTELRSLLPGYVEVWVKCRPDTAERRDPQGLYALARSGRLRGFTGVDESYEQPVAPDLVIDTDTATIGQGVESIRACLRERGYLTP